MKEEFVLLAATRGVEGSWPETVDFQKKNKECWFPWTKGLEKKKREFVENQIKINKYVNFYVHFSKRRGNSGKVEYVVKISQISPTKPKEEHLIAYGHKGTDSNGEPWKFWFKTNDIIKLEHFLDWKEDFLDYYKGQQLVPGHLRGHIILAKRI